MVRPIETVVSQEFSNVFDDEKVHFLEQLLRIITTERITPALDDIAEFRRVARPSAFFPIDGNIRMVDTTPVRQPQGTGFAFPGGRPSRS
jgi:hypothetical protein